jgi:hypothetical protein
MTSLSLPISQIASRPLFGIFHNGCPFRELISRIPGLKEASHALTSMLRRYAWDRADKGGKSVPERL